jgi:hypothetical protein
VYFVWSVYGYTVTSCRCAVCVFTCRDRDYRRFWEDTRKRLRADTGLRNRNVGYRPPPASQQHSKVVGCREFFGALGKSSQ